MLFLIFTTAFSIRWRQDKLIELSTLALLINVQCTKYIQYHGKSGTSAQLTQSQAANFEWNEFLTSLTGGYCCMHVPGARLTPLSCCSPITAVLQWLWHVTHWHWCGLPSWPVQSPPPMGPWSSNFSPVDAVCSCHNHTRAGNEGPLKGSYKSRRRPLLGPSPGWKRLLHSLACDPWTLIVTKPAHCSKIL